MKVRKSVIHPSSTVTHFEWVPGRQILWASGWVVSTPRTWISSPLPGYSDARLCGGLVHKNASGARDVMRGEETQIAGFLKFNPEFDGILCMPGTHTKWVHISAEEVVSFQTCMTGELFALLSKQSVLRHSVAGDGFDAGAFGAAIDDAMARPQNLATDLFSLRAGGLVADQTQATARARLSGLLIGAELAATRPYWLGQNVVILGDDALANLYRDGLATQGVSTATADICEITLAGLTAAHAAIKETAT